MSLEAQIAKVAQNGGISLLTSAGVIIAGKLQALSGGVAVISGATITQPGSRDAYGAKLIAVDVGAVAAVWPH